jgi:hypothetical protein
MARAIGNIAFVEKINAFVDIFGRRAANFSRAL